MGINKNMIGMTKTVTDYVAHYIKEISCNQILSTVEQRLEHDFWQLTKIIDNILSSPLNGHSSVYLTPQILSPTMVRNVVKEHPELNNTVYFNNPLLLYSTAKMTIVDIDTNLNFAHF